MNVTRILLRANAAAFVLLILFAFRRKSLRSERRLALAIAASVALQYVLSLVMDLGMLGIVRVDATSNKVMVETDVERRTGNLIFRAKYSDPESFQDYVYVYDPSEVYFDSYSVNYTRRSRPFNSGRRRGAGESFPGDGRLRMISLPASARVARTYKQPSGSKDPNFVSSINVQFFYERGGKSDAEHAEKVAKFGNMGSKGRFMIKKNGVFEDVERLDGKIR